MTDPTDREPQPPVPTVSQLFDLTGRVALITGASGYLGRSLSRALAEAGATVVASSRDLQRASELVAQLPTRGRVQHLPLGMDHLDETSIEAGCREVVSRTGRIDILVNNGHAALPADWKTVTGAQFQEHMGNAAGYFLLARWVRNHAVQQGHSASIVMLGSMYGMVGSYPDAYEEICSASPAAYHALKGGILQLTRHLAVYWAKDGVRVNSLSPGPFPGPAAPSEMVDRLKQKSPMGRMGKPHELNGALVFLASDASSYMTGQNLVIDGGWTAW